MDLLNQIQVSIYSLFFGAIFLFFFSFINRLFFKLTILKNLMIIFYFLIMTIIYFYLLVILNNGVLRIYYPLFILLGAFLYQKFYAPYVLRFFEKIVSKLNKIFIRPIYLKISKIKSILKNKKEKRKNGKRKKEKAHI